MSGALCYPACRSEFSGNGPVCWQRCPGGRHDCGALCTPTADACTDTVKGIAENVVSLAVAAATVAAGGSVDIPSIIQNLGGLAVGLANGVCERPAALEFTQA